MIFVTLVQKVCFAWMLDVLCHLHGCTEQKGQPDEVLTQETTVDQTSWPVSVGNNKMKAALVVVPCLC